jgi:pimeloyl-ACP methyl ester carboxylesterase
VSPRYTKEAAQRFREFDKPVLVAWGQEKDLFPAAYGERLSKDFPHGRLERIEDSYTFVPEDQPARLAELIREFAREPVAAAG